jgi:hypothetical protein
LEGRRRTQSKLKRTLKAVETAEERARTYVAAAVPPPNGYVQVTDIKGLYIRAPNSKSWRVGKVKCVACRSGSS